MAVTEFSAALNQICSERGVDPKVVLETIEYALVAAYRKDFGGSGKYIRAEIDRESGETKIFKRFFEEEAKEKGLKGEKVVVEVLKKDLEHPDLPGVLEKAAMIEVEVTPPGFGRIAAQTAKQVIVQKLREEEKAVVMGNYEKRIGSIVSGNVFRLSNGAVILDLGKAQGVLPLSEQIPGESYVMGERVKAVVQGVREGLRGPEVMISRIDPKFVVELFALEVPEIGSGVVEIKGISREAGNRSKVAVATTDEKVDPIGSCVGQKGVRVQAVIEELGGEKIDIIPYAERPEDYVGNALAPAKVEKAERVGETYEFKVTVAEDQLSLAIGKEGQNVRLAAKLTGFKIDIKPSDVGPSSAKATEGKLQKPKGFSELETAGLAKRTVTALEAAGIETLKELKKKSETELRAIKGIGPKAMDEIRNTKFEVPNAKDKRVKRKD